MDPQGKYEEVRNSDSPLPASCGGFHQLLLLLFFYLHCSLISPPTGTSLQINHRKGLLLTNGCRGGGGQMPLPVSLPEQEPPMLSTGREHST